MTDSQTKSVKRSGESWRYAGHSKWSHDIMVLNQVSLDCQTRTDEAA